LTSEATTVIWKHIQLIEYLFTMNKTLRQRAVLDVLRHSSIASQEDLQRVLRRRGFKVGQATLSRDIRDLNLSKTSHGYAVPQNETTAGLALPPVSRLVREFVLDIRTAQNQLVIKTIVGSAQPVAAALDEADWSEVVGTIAGDDTILIVCPDRDEARRLAGRIEEMLS
jgi:transcriptional regulator of arginine metabolism